MKRFKFRLENVLKHRETVTSLREQEFALAQSQYDAAMLELDALQAHYRQTVSQRPVAGSGEKLDAPAIQSRERFIEALQDRIARQVDRVEVARMITEEKRREMILAKQAREAVSRLRDKDHAEYVAEEQRTAQAGLDEIASVRFARQQRIDLAKPTAPVRPSKTSQR